MPALSDTKPPVKGLILADSGSGKTGALWSLAVAGFKVRLYDADNGYGVLNAALRGQPKSVIDRVEVNVFTNKLSANSQGFSVPAKGSTASAWPRLLSALNKWPDDPAGKGINDWGPDTVVVIDSLTKVGRHALLKAQEMENKTGKQPEIQHYGTAMAQMEAMLASLYGDDIRCHVLILTHVSYEKNDLGAMFGLPMALGEKLSAVIPTYFNNMLAIKISGKKRLLSTKPAAMVQTKTESFDTVKDEYLLVEDGHGKPGLAEFFADCGWPSPLAAA